MSVHYDEFAMHHTTIFWAIYSEVNCREVLWLLNKNAGLQFGPVKHSDCAQYILDQKNTITLTFVLHRTWCTFYDHGDEDVIHCDDGCLFSGS